MIKFAPADFCQKLWSSNCFWFFFNTFDVWCFLIVEVVQTNDIWCFLIFGIVWQLFARLSWYIFLRLSAQLIWGAVYEMEVPGQLIPEALYWLKFPGRIISEAVYYVELSGQSSFRGLCYTEYIWKLAGRTIIDLVSIFTLERHASMPR